MNNKLLKAIRNSKGRFFGLYTKQGEVLNAQFQRETEDYVNVYDRNEKRSRKFAKTSLKGVQIQANMIGSM